MTKPILARFAFCVISLTQIQPIILGRGWALSAGDLQITYDWEKGEWAQVPIGFQIGVVRSSRSK